MEEQEEKPLRSVTSQNVALVLFVPRTDRTVNIFWLNFSGKKVKYGTLSRGTALPVSTFETHPWVFYDAHTWDRLVTSGGRNVFHPQPSNNDENTIVYIDIPVYSLKERCLQVVRSLYDPHAIPAEDIPGSLKQELGESSESPYDVHTQ